MSGPGRRLVRLLEKLEDLLYPDDVACLACGRALGEGESVLCAGCRSRLTALEKKQAAREAEEPQPCAEGLLYVHAAFPYEETAKQLIVRLKYSSLRAAALPLAGAMAALPAGEEDLIVPVPTTARRERERGFNQAALLSEQLARAWGMEMADALTRDDELAPQASLGARERRERLRGVMRADSRVRGRRVLLIDDVYTTGETAREAARALLSAGALSVGMLTAARAHLGDNGWSDFLRGQRAKPLEMRQNDKKTHVCDGKL